jgi:hypothetical protein
MKRYTDPKTTVKWKYDKRQLRMLWESVGSVLARADELGTSPSDRGLLLESLATLGSIFDSEDGEDGAIGIKHIIPIFHSLRFTIENGLVPSVYIDIAIRTLEEIAQAIDTFNAEFGQLQESQIVLG